MRIVDSSDEVWDAHLNSLNYYSSYQRSWWYRAIEATLGGIFRGYHIVTDEHSCLIPCFVGKPWSEDGFRIGSVGYGGPIFLDGANHQTLFPWIQFIENHLQLRCTGLTHMPSTHLFDPKIKGGCQNVTQILNLPTYPSPLYDVYSGNIRTTLRKALRQNFVIRKIEEHDFDNAYQLLTETQRLVGAPYTTPPNLLRLLLFQSAEHAGGWALYSKEQMIAMGVVLFSPLEAAHYLNGWRRDFGHTGANQLLLHEMILESQRRGCRFFNFGESRTDSLKKAKERWGCNEYSVFRINLN